MNTPELSSLINVVQERDDLKGTASFSGNNHPKIVQHPLIEGMIFVGKFGTSTTLQAKCLWEIFRAAKKIQKQGGSFILVNSGAIGMARRDLDIHPSPHSPQKSMLAAHGQVKLTTYQALIAKDHDLKICQFLISHEDLADPSRRYHLWLILLEALRLGMVPVINGNDATTFKPEKSLNNDFVGADISVMMPANYFLIGTDVDGYFNTDPREPGAELIHHLYRNELEEHIASFSTQGVGTFGTGGMITKLEAAQIAASAGVETFIFNSSIVGETVDALLAGTTVYGTHCVPALSPQPIRF